MVTRLIPAKVTNWSIQKIAGSIPVGFNAQSAFFFSSFLLESRRRYGCEGVSVCHVNELFFLFFESAPSVFGVENSGAILELAWADVRYQRASLSWTDLLGTVTSKLVSHSIRLKVCPRSQKTKVS